MSRFSFLLTLIVFALPLRAQTISLEPIVSGLKNPIGVYNANDGSGRLFILEQGGYVRIWSGTQLLTTPFLDIDALTNGGGEQGLLGIVFHPNYKTNVTNGMDAPPETASMCQSGDVTNHLNREERPP